MMIAATMGVGIFSLPYVVQQAGWAISGFFLFLITFIIIQTHGWYWRALRQSEGRRLLGLVYHYGGRGIFYVAFLSIIIGLILALVAYLSLAKSFFLLLFPGQNPIIGVIVIWILGSLPLLLGVRRLVILEIIGVLAIVAILIGLFASALIKQNSFSSAPLIPASFFLPFGPLLFALAGWTSIEPTYDLEGRNRSGDGFRGVAWGTIFSAFFYIIFVFSFFLLAPVVDSDVVLSLASWPAWQRLLFSFFALLLIVKSFVLIAWEVHSSLKQDIHLEKWSFIAPVFVPPLFFFIGLTDFLFIVKLAGGFFLSLQYLFIIFVAWKMLQFKIREKILAGMVASIFISAATYEFFSFMLARI